MAAGEIAAGGAHQVLGNLRAEQQEGQFGIVHKDISGAGDGLDRVITAQLPGVHRVFFHPLQQNIQTFHYAVAAPHGAGVAPADIDIQHNAGYITTKIVGFVGYFIGIIKPGAFAIGFVAASAVLADRGRAQHREVIFTISGGIALAVGPGMLPVPSGATIPIRANRLAGIERGNGHRVLRAVLAIGVAEQVSGIAIGSFIMVGILHQRLQLTVQCAGGSIGSTGATGVSRQQFIGRIRVECFRIGRKRCGSFATGSPVVDVAVIAVDIIHICSMNRHHACLRCKYDAAQQAQNKGHRDQTIFHCLPPHNNNKV